MRVVITNDADFTGHGAGGITPRSGDGSWDAYVDDDIPNISYVFDGAIATSRFLAEAASHEAGHAFGLDHYRDEVGDSEHQPIMAEHSAANATRGTWWAGRQSYYSDFKLDIDVIARDANGFGYRADDHNNSFAGASSMTMGSGPGLHAKGVIEIPTEIDMFKFTTGGGNVSVHLDLPTFALHGLQHIGNLDPTLKLFDANGKLLAEDGDPSLNASINQTLAAGTYFVQVGSVGEYGDVGQYSLTVNEDLGAKIVSSKFQTISATQIGLLVTFNESINAFSFTTADVKINGGVAGAGVVSVVPVSTDSKTFLITMNKSSLMRVSIGPNINDLFGNRMDQNQNRLVGEAADAYFANYFESSILSTTNLTLMKPKARK